MEEEVNPFRYGPRDIGLDGQPNLAAAGVERRPESTATDLTRTITRRPTGAGQWVRLRSYGLLGSA